MPMRLNSTAQVYKMNISGVHFQLNKKTTENGESI